MFGGFAWRLRHLYRMDLVMSGEELYWYWVQANAEINCGVDSWGDLGRDYQLVWERMAQALPDMPSLG